MQVTHAAGHRYQDYRQGAFTVEVDTAAVAALSTGRGNQVWAFEVRTAYAGVERSEASPGATTGGAPACWSAASSPRAGSATCASASPPTPPWP